MTAAAGGTAARELAEAGLRVTRARLEVLGLLEELGGHRSADDVVEAFRDRGIARPRATVYHVLGTLARAGLVLIADAGPGRTLYEAAGRWHHHLVCRRCGAIVDVACASATRPCLEPDLPDAIVEEAQVIYRGLCPACARRPGASRPARRASGETGDRDGRLPGRAAGPPRTGRPRH